MLESHFFSSYSRWRLKTRSCIIKMILNARKLIRQNDSQAEMESGLRARLIFAKNATLEILHIPDRIERKKT